MSWDNLYENLLFFINTSYHLTQTYQFYRTSWSTKFMLSQTIHPPTFTRKSLTYSSFRSRVKSSARRPLHLQTWRAGRAAWLGGRAAGPRPATLRSVKANLHRSKFIEDTFLKNESTSEAINDYVGSCIRRVPVTVAKRDYVTFNVRYLA